jgi:hypothetical protein
LFRRPFHSEIACALLLAFSLVAGVCDARAAFTIQINPGAGLSGNSAALAAFNRAAQEWSSRFANDVTVYVDADLSGGFGNPYTIGQAGPTGYTNLNLDYATVRTKLMAHGAATGNEVLNYLPTTLTGMATAPSGSTIIGSTVGVLRANQRVLGLLGSDDTLADGEITFNSAFNFDYDRNDGVTFDAMDFQTVAAHELGHILGFLSDVDELDAFYRETNLTTLDLFRFAANNTPTSLAAFASTAREMRPGIESVFSDTVNSYAFSTGYYQGDRSQASHWKDDALTANLIGLMDPNLSYGAFRGVTDADLRAMELIGYTLMAVPEPGRMLLLVIGMFTLVLRRRRQG